MIEPLRALFGGLDHSAVDPAANAERHGGDRLLVYAPEHEVHLQPKEPSMSSRRIAVVLTVIACALWPAASATAQTAAKPAPRTPDGKPDLQGFWDFRTLTPLERPASARGKAVLTEEEARALQSQNAERRSRAAASAEVRNAPRDAGGGARAVGGYNDFWLDFGDSVVNDRRTSLIVDPADGRLPPRQPGIAYQAGSLQEDLPPQHPIRVLSTGASPDNPEDRGLSERCLVGFNSGPPMLPSGYNNHMQLVQTTDYVVILNEMNHDARIIPIARRAAPPAGVRQWAGMSHGRWEGDTLVVTTTNFTDKTASFAAGVTTAFGTGATLTLTERFRRADANTLLYEFTVNDPTTFTRTFTAAVPMQKSDQPVFEYACHEGNYGLMSIMRGARMLEAEQHGAR
jgi:hypothetical protein